jgi:hypothetical protein
MLNNFRNAVREKSKQCKVLCIVLALHCFIIHVNYAQVSGRIFRDFNSNGTKETNEPFISGVTVNAYLANATVPCGTTISSGNTSPNYTLNGCGVADVRIEFILPSTGSCVANGIDFTSSQGVNNGSSVQFVKGNSTNVDFAIMNPNDYNQGTSGVSVYIPTYVSGDPLPSGSSSGAQPAFLGYPYTNSGSSSLAPTRSINASQIGSTWGVAYSKQANKVFTSAFLKRHVGLGPLGSGGIYMLTPTATSFTVSNFYDMDANGHQTRALSSAPAYGEGTSYTITSNSIVTYLGANDALTGQPSGLGVIGTNSQRNLSTNPAIPSYDPAAFDQVGKVGLGGLEISDDGKYLFVMNLYSSKVFRLTLNSATNPTAVTSVTSYSLPSLSCNNGKIRPFALRFQRGKLYVGVICSGENGGQNIINGASDLNAYVFELNNPTATATFNTTAILNIPLNYNKDPADDWNPWTNNSIKGGTGNSEYPTPLLSDIDFTDRGDIIIDFMDRTGHQLGFANYRYLKSNTLTIECQTGGDILIAGLNCNGTFTLENNGTISSINSTNYSSVQNSSYGIGGDEFFYDNSNCGDPHDETAIGAIAVLKGTNEVYTTVFAGSLESGDGGIIKLSTTNGNYVANSSYTLYNRYDFTGKFGKANGLGDVEFSAIEAPIEIGNRVFFDADADGTQDAGEAGIDGVTVKLYKAGIQVGNTVTSNGGQWYFNNNNVNLNSATGILSNTAYEIKILSADIPFGKDLTVKDATSGGAADLADSDASLVGADAVITYTTGNAGENNHTLDFGFKYLNTLSVNNATICSGQSATLTASGCTGTYLWSTGATTASITVSPTITTSYGVSCITTSAQLLTNPNFETGVITPWANWGNSTITSIAAEKQNGTYGIKTNATSAGGGFAQDIAALAGETFTLTAWGKVSTATPWSAVGIKFYNSSFVALSSTNESEINATTSFQQYTLTGTAPAGTAWVQVYAWSNAGAIMYLDNFSLIKSVVSNIATGTVTVNASPPSITASNNGPICAGNTLNLITTVTGSSIVTNGNFNTASVTGFNTDIPSGSYGFTTNPTTVYSGWPTFGDKTTGTGNMMWSSDDNTATNRRQWYQSYSVTSGQTYTMRFWVRNVLSGNPTLYWSVNGTQVGLSITPTLSDGWVQLSRTWTATSTGTATFAIVLAQNRWDYDFVMDDVEILPPSSATFSWSGPSGFTSTLQNPSRTGATNAMTGTYTVTITANGCSSTATTNVTVNGSTPAISGTTSICTGSSTNLTASGGGSYLWNTGATNSVITVNPSSTTTYTVTVTNGSCSAVTSATVTVTTCPCTLTLTPTVSNCYLASGVSKATVSVKVDWANAPSGNITVSLGGQTRTITPGTVTQTYTGLPPGNYNVFGNQTIVSPQVVAFEVNANGASSTINASFVSQPSCSATANYTLPAACPITSCPTNQIGGMVFFDFDADGIRDAGETSGLSGVTVQAFNASGGLLGTTTTDSYGKYAFSGFTLASYPIRVEFSNIPSVYGNGTVNGTDGRTSVQFINSPDCNVDLGLLNGTEYCQTNPKVYAPILVNGDPLPSGSSAGAKNGLVSFDYTASGILGSSPLTVVATASQIGTLWGTAYNRFNNRLYSTALVRRHAGLGPAGIGGLYITNLSNNTTTSFDLSSIGISVGSIGSNSSRGLSTDQTQPSADAATFPAVAKQGLGDLDISEDGNFLYIVSLTDKKLNKVSISGASPTLNASYVIPDPSCSGGSWRPFATKVFRGKVYVGGVCDAQTSGAKKDLTATIYEFDPTTTTFTSIFNFPLTYPKGYTDIADPNITGWFPWVDAFSSLSTSSSQPEFVIHPQPILADLEFDIDGSIMIGFSDRTGLQVGFNNYNTSGAVASNGKLFLAVAGGDILRAQKAGSTYILENNAKAGNVTGYGANNNQGPGFGEFYNDNYNSEAGGYLHTENGFGALALLPGSGEVLVTTMDPVNIPIGYTGDSWAEYSWSGGVRHLNNTTGLLNSAVQLYRTMSYSSNNSSSGNYGKSIGLGDIEVGCSMVNYLEIGNYVWADTDTDGVQDANESPISGVDVRLYNRNGTLVGKTTTNAQGEYYFKSTNVDTTGVNATTGAALTSFSGMSPNTRYYIVVGRDGTFNTTINRLVIGAINYDLTTANIGQGTNADFNDSDATLASGVLSAFNGYPYISFLAGSQGSVNHTYDFGFKPVGSVGNYVWLDSNGDGIQNEPASNGINGVSVQLWNTGADGTIGGTAANADALVATTTTANNGSGNPGYYNFGISNSGIYYLKFPTTNGANILTSAGWITNDDTDSDPNANTGNSNVFTINVGGTGLAKDNPTFDAGYSACVNLYGVSVGPCTDVGGQSMATVTFTITSPSAGAYGQGVVEVKAGGLTQYHPAGLSNPSTSSFLLPADGTTGTITAKMIMGYSTYCPTTYSASYTLPAGCTTNPCGASGTIGGTVFNDFNANGIRDSGEQGLGAGISGVTVRVFDNSGQVGTTTTNSNGNFTVSGLTTGNKYRVEFSNYPSGYSPTYNGTVSRTDVQVATVPACLYFGLNKPSNYCQDNPSVFIPRYINGDPNASSATGFTGSRGFLYRFPFNAKDTAVATGANFGGYGLKTTFADTLFKGYQIGATWGLAYNKNKKHLYASSVLRRHTGYGPLGSGGIYKIDMTPSTPTISNWLNLDALGFATGNSTINTSNRALPSTAYTPNNDFAAYDGIGKYSLGGLEVSDDGNKLFVVNLFDRKLYIIDISNPSVAPTAANVTSVSIPTSACTASNGNFRPWALKFYNNKIYVGGVCSGETQSYQEGFPNLTGTIYSLDPSNVAGGFTQVFQYNINYRYWTNWHTTFTSYYSSSPMLTDIEFDKDGSMILGMIDRKGFQLGHQNYPPTGTTLIDGTSSGDILRVHNNNGTFVMENNGVSGPLVGMGGQTLSEPLSYTRGFFDQQTPRQLFTNGNVPLHSVAAQGALTLHLAQGQVMTTSLSPVNLYAGGVITLKTTNGEQLRPFELHASAYNSTGQGSTGKANGYGDLELMCNVAPVEIGNYVWIDADADGVQDPTESGIPNTKVQLFSRTGTLVGLTTTNASGEYYFNTGNVDTTGVNATTGAATTGFTGMSYNTRYYVVVGNGGTNPYASNSLTVGTNKYTLTGADTGQGTSPDLNDNDATIASSVNAAFNGFPYISVKTGNAGESNHTYDFGFKSAGSVGNYVWHDNNNNGLNDEAASFGINGVTVELWNAGADAAIGGTAANADVLVATAITTNNGGNPGYYNFLISSSASYFVKFPTTLTGKALTTQTTTAATDNNSDASTSTGNSPVFAINIAGIGTAKDNPTIDAGYICSVTAPTGVPASRCGTGTVTLGASGCAGGTLNWYAAASGGSSLGTGTSFTTPSITATTTYYIDCTFAGCVSTRTAVIATINAVPIVGITGTVSICSGSSTTLTASGGSTYLWSTSATTVAITVSPTATTTYSVTATSAAGCTAAANQTVTVTTPPNAGTASPLSICKTEISATTDLFAQLVGEQTGGTWQSIAPYPAGVTATMVNSKVTSGILQRKGFPAGAYTFRYTVIGTSPCPNDTEDVIITINSCCPPAVCLPTSSTRQ